MLNLFKKSKKTADVQSKIKNISAKAQKLNEKEVKQVMGGAVNYNASKTNTGN